MDLRELTAYAKAKYGIEEQYKWADFPDSSVLCHPDTGKWVALLMRQWDMDTGTEIQRCDLKCGALSLLRFQRPYLSAPVRMRGVQWLNIRFDQRTEPEVVYQLFDRAIASGKPHGVTLVLDHRTPSPEAGYQDTALPFAGAPGRREGDPLPDRLREMRRLYEYGSSTMVRARSFYRQAQFMRDYEDDLPWEGDFNCYYPTYHDMNTRQLRGYFGWRTQLRRGNAQPIPASAAYVYIYELLNGVGAATPEESLQKLREFEKLYLDAGLGDGSMRGNLRRWMLEFAVLRDLPPELARECADPELMALDSALSALRRPEGYLDSEIFSALCLLGGKKLESSPVLSPDPDRGRALFAGCWRAASSYSWQGQELFSLCFGQRSLRRWYPLVNAVYYEQQRPRNREYRLDPCRSYVYRNGLWQVLAYEKSNFDKARLQGFLHQAEARLRRYLSTGRYLKEKPEDAWAIPYVDKAIEEDRKAQLEARRQSIRIDLSGLEQIRRDADQTRESLLTQEEREDTRPPQVPAAPEPIPAAPEAAPSVSLEPGYRQLLQALLAGQDPGPILKARRLMPSIAADAINEALFDEIGDTVLLCEGDALALVEDYTEDLKRILGGNSNG